MATSKVEMKKLFLGILILLFLAITGYCQESEQQSVYTETIDLNVGMVKAPKGYLHKRTGTKDSQMGQITDDQGKLTIYYDIGVMAGTHMHPKLKSDCLWYKEQIINAHKVFSGLMNKDGKKLLLVTITEEGSKDSSQFPANFWAYVNGNGDIAEVSRIVLSYSP